VTRKENAGATQPKTSRKIPRGNKTILAREGAKLGKKKTGAQAEQTRRLQGRDSSGGGRRQRVCSLQIVLKESADVKARSLETIEQGNGEDLHADKRPSDQLASRAPK